MPDAVTRDSTARVAVVGSGLAGLTAAWLLGRRCSVTVFEEHTRPGMGAHSIRLDDDGALVDVPLRVFTPAYYPRLLELYASADIRVDGVDYAASFSRLGGGTYFRYRNVRIAGRSIPWMPPTALLRRTPRSIARDLWRLLRTAPGQLQAGGPQGLSLDVWLRSEGYGSDFVDGFLIPTYAALCTCSQEAVRAYPADIILTYACSGVTTLGVMRSSRGSDDVVRRLLAPAADVRTGTAVRRIRSGEAGVDVTDATGETTRVDHVVLATRADQAARLLEGDPRLADLLGRVPHEESRIVVHGDARLAPVDASAWRPVNLIVSDDHPAPMATIWLDRVQEGVGERGPLFQTWNPLMEPDPATVITEARVTRPVVTVATHDLPHRLVELHDEPHRRVWPVGSYAEVGIPLLEAAASSGMRVAEALATRL